MKRAIPIIIMLTLLIVAAFVVIPIVNRADPDTRRKIAFVAAASDGDFSESLRRGAEQAVEGTDFRIFSETPTGQDPTESLDQIVERLIARGVCGVVVACRDAKSLLPLVEKVCDANIPCVAIGPHVDSERLLCRVDADDYITGLTAARRMARILSGKGKIVVIDYVPGSTWTAQRINGFGDTIEREFPEMQIVDSKFGMDSIETASAAAEGLLKKHAQIDGLFACNESTSAGALKALRNSGLAGKVKMVGFGVESSLVEGLRTGSIDSLIAQDPCKMGRQAVNAMLGLIAGAEVERHIGVELTLLTRSNVDTPEFQSLPTPAGTQ